MTNPLPDPYAVLGIPRDARAGQVRDAYRRLAKRYHPDLHPGARTRERMRGVNQAWHVLSDPARRARYDADHPRPGSPRPAHGTGSDARSAGWAASAWAFSAAGEPRSRADAGSSSGPPWLALLAVLAVGWLVVGGIFGGFLLPPGLGILALLAAGRILGRSA